MSKPVTERSHRQPRLVNMLGAAALGVTDAMLGDVAADLGLDATAVAALVTMLDLAPSDSVQRLSLMTGISHSGTVRLVSRLVAAGFVERTPGPDARTLAVRLTRRGQFVARRIRDARQAGIAAALTGLTDRQREQLTAICEVMVANVTTARLAARQAGRQPRGGALCRMCDPVACGRPDGNCPAAQSAANT